MIKELALFDRGRTPHSVDTYVGNVVKALERRGVAISRFPQGTEHSTADLLWDPGAGRPAPPDFAASRAMPLVVTFHGAANVSMSLQECFGPDVRKQVFGALSRASTKRGWRRLKGRRFRAIAVSQFAAEELLSFAPIDPEDVTVIHHGVDHDVFRPNGAPAELSPYYLHVSSSQPVKNIDRMLAAYSTLEGPEIPMMVVVSPGYKRKSVPANVELITTPLDHVALSKLYRSAAAFVFPSLRETFGLPILEAMASGCPVITARDTGCVEVAGESALLVNPRSVEEIADAMGRVMLDDTLRDVLRRKGLARAARFTWERCAEQHLAVFEDVLRQRAAA